MLKESNTLIPHLFRTEFSKIVSVLTKTFGLNHIEVAEDIVSDTFLLAAETWGKKGLPDNPTAWLYTVAKNKTKDYLKRNTLFTQKISVDIKHQTSASTEVDIDLSDENISDSQLKMMFAICHPTIAAEAQVGLSLRILCGFGIDEIASAFLSNKETVNKRLFRAKEKLREAKVNFELPEIQNLNDRLQNVLTTLYLLFNEGYYSNSTNTALRKDLCLEAMRLTLMLVNNAITNKPHVNALLSLMCFHASRFDARLTTDGEIVLYEEQDVNLWDLELILRGEYYLNKAAIGTNLSKYHLEAAIAYWHTQKQDTAEKWEKILQLYNKLLQIDYSPIAALNRTYALYKTTNALTAIKELEKINLKDSHLYHGLLGNLYLEVDVKKAHLHLQTAFTKAKSEAERRVLKDRLEEIDRMDKGK